MCSWSNTQNTKVDTLDWELTSQEAEKHYPTPPADHTLGTERGEPEKPHRYSDCVLWHCGAKSRPVTLDVPFTVFVYPQHAVKVEQGVK